MPTMFIIVMITIEAPYSCFFHHQATLQTWKFRCIFGLLAGDLAETETTGSRELSFSAQLSSTRPCFKCSLFVECLINHSPRFQRLKSPQKPRFEYMSCIYWLTWHMYCGVGQSQGNGMLDMGSIRPCAPSHLCISYKIIVFLNGYVLQKYIDAHIWCLLVSVKANCTEKYVWVV